MCKLFFLSLLGLVLYRSDAKLIASTCEGQIWRMNLASVLPLDSQVQDFGRVSPTHLTSSSAITNRVGRHSYEFLAIDLWFNHPVFLALDQDDIVSKKKWSSLSTFNHTHLETHLAGSIRLSCNSRGETKPGEAKEFLLQNWPLTRRSFRPASSTQEQFSENIHDDRMQENGEQVGHDLYSYWRSPQPILLPLLSENNVFRDSFDLFRLFDEDTLTTDHKHGFVHSHARNPALTLLLLLKYSNDTHAETFFKASDFGSSSSSCSIMYIPVEERKATVTEKTSGKLVNFAQQEVKFNAPIRFKGHRNEDKTHMQSRLQHNEGSEEVCLERTIFRIDDPTSSTGSLYPYEFNSEHYEQLLDKLRPPDPHSHASSDSTTNSILQSMSQQSSNLSASKLHSVNANATRNAQLKKLMHTKLFLNNVSIDASEMELKNSRTTEMVLLEEQLNTRIPGAGLIMKPIFGGVMKPVVEVTTDGIASAIKNTAGRELECRINDEVPPSLVIMLGTTTRDNMTNILTDTVTESTIKALTATLVTDLGPHIKQNVEKSLTPKLGNVLTNVLKETIPEKLKASVPRVLERFLTLTVTAALTRSLTHSLVPTLALSLTHHKEAQHFCWSCYSHNIACDRCHFSPESMYYHIYHAGFYTDYFSAYYTDYYLAALREVDSALNPISSGMS